MNPVTSLVRSLATGSGLADPDGEGGARYRRSSLQSRPRRSASTARTSGCTISRASRRRRSAARGDRARTNRIEIGTAVIDMRYENPLYIAEEAAAADLISDGRLQLGVSRGSPESVVRGSRRSATCRARTRPTRTSRVRTRRCSGRRSPARGSRGDIRMTGSDGALAIEPQSPGLSDRITAKVMQERVGTPSTRTCRRRRRRARSRNGCR